MNTERAIQKQRKRRRYRVRRNIRGTADCPRLSVYRSHKHIYCQIIDDTTKKTLAAASSRDKDHSASYGGNCDAALTVGKRLAEKALEAGIKQVKFDRGSYKYHGRVAALADAVREVGISL
ncbi:MAG: 50S ribosomal protein L18 [Planctomycetaceae bacterium]|nr:50S ribosomal protein L18 [Planctomycetaceae bacterium]MBP60579.1 50S ribosomal protein L18 [Planctomycetaceae bacterium]